MSEWTPTPYQFELVERITQALEAIAEAAKENQEEVARLRRENLHYHGVIRDYADLREKYEHVKAKYKQARELLRECVDKMGKADIYPAMREKVWNLLDGEEEK